MWRQEGRRRPLRAAGAVSPGDAAQVDGIEQERTDVDVFAAQVCCHLLRNLALRTSRRPPHHGGLASLDQEGERAGELAGAERVVGGDGVGFGHGRAPGEWMSRPKRLWTIRPSPGPSPAFALAGSGQTGRLNGPVLAMRKRSNGLTHPAAAQSASTGRQDRVHRQAGIPGRDELWPRVGDGLREGGGVSWGVTKPPGLQARSDTP